MEFVEILQTHTNDVLEIITDLARCCSDALNVVRGFKSKLCLKFLEEEFLLECECNMWRLIYILYQDRLCTQSLIDDEVPQYFGMSEKLCVLNLFKRDNLVRESQLVIDWLESAASERDNEVLHFSDKTVGWENTLHQLQSNETIAFRSTRPTVTSLDPDAPFYQSLPLHDIDTVDEERLCNRIFKEIRCGKLDAAQQVCH